MKVGVIGGGIAGLAAAWEAASAGHDVTLLEAGDRFGGKIRTSTFAGVPIDEGPDAFITRTPAAVELCRAVGLGDAHLVSPSTGRAFLWVGGELRPVPGGTVLGVPVDLDEVAASGVLTPQGLDRAAREPDQPGLPLTGDASIGALITERFGREVAERLVDPLLGGINAGGIDHLSLDVAAPQIAAVARRHASLLHGLRAVRDQAPPAPPGGAPPVFLAPAGGMERLVEAVVAQLRDREAELHLGRSAESLSRAEGRWRVTTDEPAGGVFEADGVVVATPAFVAGGLLSTAAPSVADLLRAVEYASVVLVTLAYRADDVGRPLDGSGFLVPKPEGRLLTAGSWFTSKWGHLEPTAGTVIVRASAGRRGDRRALDMDDESLVAAVHLELSEAMDLAGDPIDVRVSRWEQAFPQFLPGHLERIDSLERDLAAAAPGVALAGAYLRGVGIPACIAGARTAVQRLVA